MLPRPVHPEAGEVRQALEVHPALVARLEVDLEDHQSLRSGAEGKLQSLCWLWVYVDVPGSDETPHADLIH